MDSEYFQYFPVLKDFKKGGIFYDEKIDFKVFPSPFVPEKIKSVCIYEPYHDISTRVCDKILVDYILSLFGLIRQGACKRRPYFHKVKRISQEQLDAIIEYFGEFFPRDFVVFQQT